MSEVLECAREYSGISGFAVSELELLGASTTEPVSSLGTYWRLTNTHMLNLVSSAVQLSVVFLEGNTTILLDVTFSSLAIRFWPDLE